MRAKACRRWIGERLVPREESLPAHAPGATQAVLVYAVGWDLWSVAAFVRSLGTVYAGRTILIVGGDLTLQAYLRTRSIEVEIIRRRWLQWRPSSAIARFSIYSEVLQRRPEIRTVAITTIDGGGFGKDPFLGDVGVLKFEADPVGRRLAHDAGAMSALRRLIGRKAAQVLGERQTISVTRIVGPSDAVVRLCRIVLMVCAGSVGTRGRDKDLAAAACHMVAHLRLPDGQGPGGAEIGQCVALGEVGR